MNDIINLDLDSKSEAPVQMGPKVVVIVGNGFDIDLKLKTKYIDFIRSDYFKPLITSEPVSVIKNFFDFYVMEPKMILHENGLAQFMKKNADDRNWSNLEQDVHDYCYLHKGERNSITIRNELLAVRYFLYKYFQFTIKTRDVIRDENIGERVACHLIEGLKDWNADFRLWSFNYTDTCEEIMKHLNMHSDLERVYQIHGSIAGSSKGDLDLVMGTCYDEIVATVCPSAIKSKMADEEKYKENVSLLRQHLIEADSLVIMGHSMGDSDRQYFEEVLRQSTCLKKILVINYREEDLDDVFINMNQISGGRMGQLIQSGEIDYRTFSTNDYFEASDGIAVAWPKENKQKKLLDLLKFAYSANLSL